MPGFFIGVGVAIIVGIAFYLILEPASPIIPKVHEKDRLDV